MVINITQIISIIAKETDAEESVEPLFDFSSPEDVLIFVEHNGVSKHNSDWDGWEITSCQVISGKEGVTGAASYENSYGGFLDYTLMGMIDCPKKEGFYVVVGMTGYYSKGDWGYTEDEMELYYDSVRPAAAEEIKLG